MTEFLEAQSQVKRQKVQLKFEVMQLKETVSFHCATLFLRLYPNRMVHLLRYGLVSQEWSI